MFSLSSSMGLSALLPTFILLSTLVISLLSTTSFVAALNTNFARDPNISASSKAKMATLLDPNPVLIDKHGNLIQDTTFLLKLKSRNGTIADGVSKLIIEVNYSRPLNFSIVGKSPNNLSEGTLSPLMGPSIKKPSSSTVVNQTKNGTSVVAVYTPPDFINEPTADHKNIRVSINDTQNHISISSVDIRLYHPPVVLVHGLWENSSFWQRPLSTFSQVLSNAHLYVTLANYSKYNATTFDPYANKTFGNYGINATKYAIHFALNKLHNQSIAAAQADVIGHSMGGLIARGLVQQPDYNSSTNYMKGYIHRLTIGTPHFGGQLAGPFYSHRNDWYYYAPATKAIIFPTGCQFDPMDFELMQLKTIYKNELHAPIDAGGVEAMIPGSIAYSHLCPTNVKSYAIVGSWGPNAVASHFLMESLFKNILGDPTFNLDTDGFRGNFQGDNDLQVNLTSQAGGLHTKFLTSNTHGALPNESKGYNNTLHTSIFIALSDQSLVRGELSSIQIQNDVSKLLNSDDGKFAESIGIGAPCDIPKN